jgi:hypothetical protein
MNEAPALGETGAFGALAQAIGGGSGLGGVPIHLWTQTSDNIELFQTEGACQNYRCLAPVVAGARHRRLRIQDQHRDAASGDAKRQGNE